MNKLITLKNGIVVSPVSGTRDNFRIVSIPKEFSFRSILFVKDVIFIGKHEQANNFSLFSFRPEPKPPLSFPEKELTRLLNKPKFRALRTQHIQLVHMACNFTKIIVSVSNGTLTPCGISRCSPTDTFSFETGFSIALTRALEKLVCVTKMGAGT